MTRIGRCGNVEKCMGGWPSWWAMRPSPDAAIPVIIHRLSTFFQVLLIKYRLPVATVAAVNIMNFSEVIHMITLGSQLRTRPSSLPLL